MQILAEQVLDDGTLERSIRLEDAPGVVWTPASAWPSEPAPLVLLGHPGGLGVMRPRLAARARSSAALGLATATVEVPGSGDRPRIAAVEEARTALRQAIAAGERPTPEVVDALVLPLVDQAVPELQALLDSALELPEVGGPAGISGGIIAIGVRLAHVEARIAAASLFAGSFVPRSILAEARDVSIPVHVLLQWDDRGNDRQTALELFDAFGSQEKTLQANLGGHTGIPAYAAEDAGRFLVRHLLA